jgi:hypothetical protein
MIDLLIRRWASGATVDKELLVKALRKVIDDFEGESATCPFCGRKFRRDPRGLLENPYCPHCTNQRLKASGAKPLPPGRWVEDSGYSKFVPDEEEAK